MKAARRDTIVRQEPPAWLASDNRIPGPAENIIHNMLQILFSVSTIRYRTVDFTKDENFALQEPVLSK